MIKPPRFYRDNSLARIRELLARYAGLAALSSAMLLTLPLLDPYLDRRELHDTRPAAEAPAPEASSPKVGVTLRRGDTLLSVLTRLGLEPPSAHAMIEKVRPLLNPRRLRPGHTLQVVLHPEDKTVQGMEVTLGDSLVRVKATGGGWLAERQEIPFVRASRVIRGMIADSLYQSGTEAGLAPQQILDLSQIFEYDVDFFSDFQPGDSFSVAVEEIRYADGRRAPGRILAAELEANSEGFSAVYFTAQDGSAAYYDNDGRAVRRSFLRAPLSYARISSPFSLNRRHPIFRTLRPHRAIDYAAPAGTPAVAVGRGRVEFSGWRAGYGNMVDVRHNGGYLSRYAHFSRIAAGIRRGKEVDAGNVLGYVGQTGHATGPHLHFEFLKGNEKINFLSLKIPRVDRLAGPDLRRFAVTRDERLALLRGQDVEAKSTRSDL
ncbi:MAG: M23 family metallopeptidase [Candidatus Binatia bacterium]